MQSAHHRPALTLQRKAALVKGAVLDHAGHKDDALAQEARVDVEGAFATVRLLDHHGNERVHVKIVRIPHIFCPLALPRVADRTTGLVGWTGPCPERALGGADRLAGKSNRRDGPIAGDTALTGGKGTDRRQ